MDLRDHSSAFNRVGWFIPPYVSVGFLSNLIAPIKNASPSNQRHLEAALATVYTPGYLASMVCERYPLTPHIKAYKGIIAEAIEAHFMGLGHAAVSGILPVIEGAGKRLLVSRSLTARGMKNVFIKLAADCKKEAIEKNIGAADEIACMMDSFIEFTGKHLYAQPGERRSAHNVNRHGPAHGAFADGEYGDPIHFYKAIGAVDFLCLIASFRATPLISWLAPNPTKKSLHLGSYYAACKIFAEARPPTS